MQEEEEEESRKKKKNCFHLYHTKIQCFYLFFNFILLLNHVPAAAASLFLLLLLPLLLRFVLAVSSCVCAPVCVLVCVRVSEMQKQTNQKIQFPWKI